MQLSPRLSAIARLIKRGDRVADIGTDHGYLPVWLVGQGVCPLVIATDLREGPLNTARRNAAENGIHRGVDFRLADGLEAVSPGEVDTVVIAGMGGETIAGILAAATWLREGAYSLILQPQSKIPELMDWLAANGYRVRDQHLVADGGTMYTIYAAEPGEMPPLTGGGRYVLAELLDRGDPLLAPYMAEIAGRLRRALDGLAQASGPEAERKRTEFSLALRDLENWRGELEQ